MRATLSGDLSFEALNRHRERRGKCTRVGLSEQITMLRAAQYDFDASGLSVPYESDDRVNDAMQASGNAANRRLGFRP